MNAIFRRIYRNVKILTKLKIILSTFFYHFYYKFNYYSTLKILFDALYPLVETLDTKLKIILLYCLDENNKIVAR